MTQHKNHPQLRKLTILAGATLIALATGAQAGGGGHGGHHGSHASVSNPPRPVTMRPDDLNGGRPDRGIVRDHRNPSSVPDSTRAPGGVVVTAPHRPVWGGPTIRDHRDQPAVRDHRAPAPGVRDHRDHRDRPVVRDHRRSTVLVRDHRGEAAWHAPYRY